MTGMVFIGEQYIFLVAENDRMTIYIQRHTFGQVTNVIGDQCRVHRNGIVAEQAHDYGDIRCMAFTRFRQGAIQPHLQFIHWDIRVGPDVIKGGLPGTNGVRARWPNTNFKYIENTDCGHVTKVVAWPSSNEYFYW